MYTTRCDELTTEVSLLKADIEKLKAMILNLPAKTHSFEAKQNANLELDLRKSRQQIDGLVTTVAVLSEQLLRERQVNAHPPTITHPVPADHPDKTPQPQQVDKDSSIMLVEMPQSKQKRKRKKNQGKTTNETPKSPVSSNSVNSSQPKKPVTVIAGDSMIQNIRGWDLSDTSKVVVKSFSGATTEDMEDFLKPVLRKEPEQLILHVGTNDLKTQDPELIFQSIVSLQRQVEESSPNTNIGISAILPRKEDGSTPNLAQRISRVNSMLKTFCQRKQIGFIEHRNINLDHLNRGGLHLTKTGSEVMSKNLKTYINSSN